MIFTLCIASRGNPEQLCHVIRETDGACAHPEQLRISVALDEDDPGLPRTAPETRAELIWSIAPREDSLGAKYNRCQRNAPAEAYLMGADDNIFDVPGWDDQLRLRFDLFPDKLGFVYFGRLDGSLPTQMAIPHLFVERRGQMFTEHFPVWFHDTDIDEHANMMGRTIWADIHVEEIGGRGKSRGIRDIAFWTNLFEALRPERQAFADKLSQEFNLPWMHAQLYQRRRVLTQFLAFRNERLRNPATAVQFEQRMSHDAPADERYLRMKAKAQALMAELTRPAKELADA